MGNYKEYKKNKKRNTKKRKRNTKREKRKLKYTKKLKQEGGTDCLSYIISGRHGFLLYDKDDSITIPDNIRLILYSDFCGKACNNVKTITKYICNHKSSKVNEIAHKIINPGSTIPELYVISDIKDSIKLTNCYSDIIYHNEYNSDKKLNKVVPLSKIIEELINYLKENNLEDVKIDLHWIVCLDVYDKNKIKINDPDNNILKKNKDDYTEEDIYKILKYTMDDCNEQILGVDNKLSNQNFAQCSIKVKKNTIHVISTRINNKNIIIYLTYPEVLRTNAFSLPNLITKIENNREQINLMLFDKIKHGEVEKSFEEYINKRIVEYERKNIIPNIEYNEDGENLTININMEDNSSELIKNIINILLNVIYFSIMNIPSTKKIVDKEKLQYYSWDEFDLN
jgi:hypothetical protein